MPHNLTGFSGTVSLGKNSVSLFQQAQKAQNDMATAIELLADKIRKGEVRCSQMDIKRGVIEDASFGDYFIRHSPSKRWTMELLLEDAPPQPKAAKPKRTRRKVKGK